MTNNISSRLISMFADRLCETEHRSSTVGKYSRDITRLLSYSGGLPLTKETLIGFKSELIRGFSPASVNSIIASVNSYLDFISRPDLKLKGVRIQRGGTEDRELSRGEYLTLVETAERMGDKRMSLVLQTICSTGIRVSELPFVTVEAVKTGRARVYCKGKCRTVFLPNDLCTALESWCDAHKITEGAVFVTRNGKPLDRSNIYRSMQKLGRCAGIAPEKLFPHNLRHLFAKTYYAAQKDIVRLADILGHSDIATTRIYIGTSDETCAAQINALGLVKGIEKGTKKQHNADYDVKAQEPRRRALFNTFIAALRLYITSRIPRAGKIFSGGLYYGKETTGSQSQKGLHAR